MIFLFTTRHHCKLLWYCCENIAFTSCVKLLGYCCENMTFISCLKLLRCRPHRHKLDLKYSTRSEVLGAGGNQSEITNKLISELEKSKLENENRNLKNRNQGPSFGHEPGSAAQRPHSESPLVLISVEIAQDYRDLELVVEPTRSQKACFGPLPLRGD
jgi:hypothetical protein